MTRSRIFQNTIDFLVWWGWPVTQIHPVFGKGFYGHLFYRI